MYTPYIYKVIGGRFAGGQRVSRALRRKWTRASRVRASDIVESVLHQRIIDTSDDGRLAFGTTSLPRASHLIRVYVH